MTASFDLFVCADVPNCGRPFKALDPGVGPMTCPYCNERAERIEGGDA